MLRGFSLLSRNVLRNRQEIFGYITVTRMEAQAFSTNFDGIPTLQYIYKKTSTKPLPKDGEQGSKYSPRNDLNKIVGIYQGDITKLQLDCIVNAANQHLIGGGGVDGAIHRAAGPLLQKECKNIGGCDIGDAKITDGYNLLSKRIIHTVGPYHEQPTKLESCYRRALEIAVQNNLRSIAFPCISTGVYGYPNDSAAHVALASVRTFLEASAKDFDRVIFCVFLDKDKAIYEKLIFNYFPPSS